MSVMTSNSPPVTDLIEYLEASSAKLLALDIESGEGLAMRDAALRIKALLSMLSDEQDAAIVARNYGEQQRQLANNLASSLNDTEREANRSRERARGALKRAAAMLGSVAGDVEDGVPDDLSSKYVKALINARDDALAEAANI